MKSKYYYYTALMKCIVAFTFSWKETAFMKSFIIPVIVFDIPTVFASIMAHYYFADWASTYYNDHVQSVYATKSQRATTTFFIYMCTLFAFGLAAVSFYLIYGYLFKYLRVKRLTTDFYLIAKYYVIAWSIFVAIICLSPVIPDQDDDDDPKYKTSTLYIY